MPMKVLEATLATFDGVFQQFTNEAANNKANFILFYADKEPSTNLSWCPGTHLLLIHMFNFVDYCTPFITIQFIDRFNSLSKIIL